MLKKENKKSAKFWQELRISAPSDLSESVADCLFGAGAEAVEERGEMDDVVLVAHFPAGAGFVARFASLGKNLAELARVSGAGAALKVSIRKIEDYPWALEARKNFKPVEIVPGLRVAPTWAKVKKKPNEILLRIDPGEAFGTGLHASTKLCAGLMIEAISRFDAPKTLDVGTGTGILAMIAFLKGAGKVAANDNDPKALEVAAENFERNGCPVELVGIPVENMRGKFEVIAANILFEELERLSIYLARRLVRGGVVVLSGLLVPQAEQMKKIMRKSGMKFWKEKSEAEWIAMGFIKP